MSLPHCLKLLIGSCILIMQFFSEVYGQDIPGRVELDTIHIITNRTPTSLQELERIDPLSIPAGILKVLESGTGLHIRSAVPGAPVSVSARGLPSRHLQLIWNGLPVQSSLTSSTDFSLYGYDPGAMLGVGDEAMALMNGGNPISGALHIIHSPVVSTPLSFRISQGSFGYWNAGISGNWTGTRWKGGISGEFERARNDYSYIDYTTNPEGKGIQEHAAFEKVILQSHHFYNPGERDRLDMHVLWSWRDREVPAALVSNLNEVGHLDRQMRWVTSWSRAGNNFTNKLKAGLLHDYLQFDDHGLQVSHRNESWKFLLGEHFSYAFHPSVSLMGDLQLDIASVSADVLEGRRLENGLHASVGLDVILANQ